MPDTACTRPLDRARSLNAGSAAWEPSFVDHGWYYAVEPFTGMSIQGHKVG